MLCLKIAVWVANIVDPDETPRSAASHLGLHCLLRPVCLNTYVNMVQEKGVKQSMLSRIFRNIKIYIKSKANFILRMIHYAHLLQNDTKWLV